MRRWSLWGFTTVGMIERAVYILVSCLRMERGRGRGRVLRLELWFLGGLPDMWRESCIGESSQAGFEIVRCLVVTTWDFLRNRMCFVCWYNEIFTQDIVLSLLV